MLLEILEQAKTTVQEVGEIISANSSKAKKVKLKGRIDLVTETDYLVEQELKKNLKSILPEANFLAEETEAESALKDLTWILDPLDGTTNYAHSLPCVATSLALWQKGEVQMGIVHLPLLKETFWALKGQGAYLNQQRISVSKREDLEHCLIATGFPYNIQKRLSELVPLFEAVLARCRGVRRMGAAAVDLAYTACGRFDCFYELGLKPWDVAAGWLLVTEAGGLVSKIETDKSYNLYSDSILASNGKIHQSMQNLLLKKQT